MEKSTLDKLREIRQDKNLKLKPSPYLKSTYIDDSGKEFPVKIRNYQAQGIMNLLQMPFTVLGDATGLGKTLSILSTIGYIWFKEPNYIPIVITTKSSLFQWVEEINKFMVGIEAVTISGEPHKRHELYESFFLKHDPNKKRLLLLTYDMIMYDMEENVIRSKAKSPRRGFQKEMDEAKLERNKLEENTDALKSSIKESISEASYEIQEYARYLSYVLYEHKEIVNKPPDGWSNELSKIIKNFISSKIKYEASVEKVKSLTAELAPPKPVPGIIDYAQECLKNNSGIQFMLVMDEMHKLKNYKSQFHAKTARLSQLSSRRIGMTATPIKNRLMEFFGLFRIIKPDLFPKVTHFQNEFCVTKLIRVHGGRQVPIIVGYKNLDKFISVIEPYYLSRQKHEVSEELPESISREVECELSNAQEELYDMAEAGSDDDSDEEDGASVLKALTLCQQAADAPALIKDSEGNPFEGESSKIDMIVDLLENEIHDQKVIIFSIYEKMISLIESVLNEHKIKSVRITGAESKGQVRQANKLKFQDPNSGINVILITNAGAESLNLQAAEHFIFVDLPRSWGDYVQLTGRAVRIGSKNLMVTFHHLLARKRDGSKTIDHHVLNALKQKKHLADKVAGESIKNGLVFVDERCMNNDILDMIRNGRKVSDINNKKSSTKPKKKIYSSDSSISVKIKEENYNGPDFSDL